eukprot:TRINITY_DN2482_c0_g3_i2.p1 TRINITY_DN2482_c0_g3~~TRINITY_DN2482_c0_g3_i2.p1  ORF type:complete len:240 (-),score=12.67 TRINITY_DN2482_c0_g3_i2:352-1071(-)
MTAHDPRKRPSIRDNFYYCGENEANPNKWREQSDESRKEEETKTQMTETLLSMQKVELNLKWSGIKDDELVQRVTNVEEGQFLTKLNLELSRSVTWEQRHTHQISQPCVLHLQYTNITDASLKGIAASASFKCLQKLDLQGCLQISDDGVVAIATSRHLSTLCNLNLSWTNITDIFLRTIAASVFLQEPPGTLICRMLQDYRCQSRDHLTLTASLRSPPPRFSENQDHRAAQDLPQAKV